MTDELIELIPPDAQRVAERALVLSAMACRGSIEFGKPNADVETLRIRIVDWLNNLSLASSLEPDETLALNANVGSLGKEIAYRFSWSIEGLAVMNWAMRRSPFPQHDQKVDPFALTDSLSFLNEKASSIISDAVLQDQETLKSCRELLYAIHCRLRDFKRDPKAKDIRDWIEPAWLRSLQIDATKLLAGNDLAIGGVELAAATAEARQSCEWIINARHRASIWLIGEEHPNYWNFPVDT